MNLSRIGLMVSAAVVAGGGLQSGWYEPIAGTGNNDSICPQKIKSIAQEGELTALRVTYVGYCEGMGTFEYYCSREAGSPLVCEGNGVRYEIHSEARYRWVNETYGISADFALTRDELQRHLK